LVAAHEARQRTSRNAWKVDLTIKFKKKKKNGFDHV
jgi:hypothetical protein